MLFNVFFNLFFFFISAKTQYWIELINICGISSDGRYSNMNLKGTNQGGTKVVVTVSHETPIICIWRRERPITVIHKSSSSQIYTA